MKIKEVKVNKYIAFDGKEFDNIEECCEYEAMFTDCTIKVITYDDKVETLEYSKENEAVTAIKYFENNIDSAKYIWIKTDRDLEIVDMLNDYCGYELPHSKGTFFYDDLLNSWIPLKEEIDRLTEKYNRLVGVE